MARPRSFDPADVLTAAQDVFHSKGYEATSVQDLVEATGLSRSSLYAAFGDKHGLYLAVLDRYAAQGRQALQDLCGCTSPLGALRAFLVRAATGPAEGPPPGCLLTNVAAECASHDPETARRASASRQTMTQAFKRLVRDAQAAGEVDRQRDPESLAHFLTGAVYGIHGLVNAGANAGALADMVEATVAAVAAS